MSTSTFTQVLSSVDYLIIEFYIFYMRLASQLIYN